MDSMIRAKFKKHLKEIKGKIDWMEDALIRDATKRQKQAWMAKERYKDGWRKKNGIKLEYKDNK